MFHTEWIVILVADSTELQHRLPSPTQPSSGGNLVLLSFTSGYQSPP